MERFQANTKRLPCAVDITINTGGSQVPIYVIGYDPLNPHTLYFRSRFRLSGLESIRLNCPQSPILLNILIWAEDDMPYELGSIDILPLEVTPSDDPSVRFIERFSRICGRLRPGLYQADDVPFFIEFKRKIYTDDGQEHTTPARIHEDLPLVQVSEAKFDQDTIPERIAILLHEYSHNFINYNPDNEQEADQNALNIYRQLGYPNIEAMNAFGDIMPDTNDNFQRMQNFVNI
jgi:hypothetical protein